MRTELASGEDEPSKQVCAFATVEARNFAASEPGTATGPDADNDLKGTSLVWECLRGIQFRGRGRG
jgi:hypothetical protein